jgi:hypothetical protein
VSLVLLVRRLRATLASRAVELFLRQRIPLPAALALPDALVRLAIKLTYYLLRTLAEKETPPEAPGGALRPSTLSFDESPRI